VYLVRLRSRATDAVDGARRNAAARAMSPWDPTATQRSGTDPRGGTAAADRAEARSTPKSHRAFWPGFLRAWSITTDH